MNTLRDIALRDLNTEIVYENTDVIDHPMFSTIYQNIDGNYYNLADEVSRAKFIKIKADRINMASDFVEIALEYDVDKMIYFLKDYYELADSKSLAYIFKGLIKKQYFKVVQLILGKDLTLKLLRLADRNILIERKLDDYVIVYRGRRSDTSSSIQYDGGIFACEVPNMVLINKDQFIDNGDTEVAGFKIKKETVLAYIDVEYTLKNKETGEKAHVICGVCAMDRQEILNLASERDVENMLRAMKGQETVEEEEERLKALEAERADRSRKLIEFISKPNRNVEWSPKRESEELSKGIEYILSEATWFGLNVNKIRNLEIDYMMNFFNVEEASNKRLDYIAEHAGWDKGDVKPYEEYLAEQKEQ